MNEKAVENAIAVHTHVLFEYINELDADMTRKMKIAGNIHDVLRALLRGELAPLFEPTSTGAQNDGR